MKQDERDLLRNSEDIILGVCRNSKAKDGRFVVGAMFSYNVDYYMLTPKKGFEKSLGYTSYLIGGGITPETALRLDKTIVGFATNITNQTNLYDKELLSLEDMFIELESRGMLLYHKAKLK